jgi:hypothetical protein
MEFPVGMIQMEIESFEFDRDSDVDRDPFSDGATKQTHHEL